MKSSFIRDLLATAARYENKVAFVDLDGSRSTTYGQLLALARKVIWDSVLTTRTVGAILL